MAPINEAGTGGYVVGDMGSTNNVDTLKNIWFDENEAWEGIDEVCIVTTHPSLLLHLPLFLFHCITHRGAHRRVPPDPPLQTPQCSPATPAIPGLFCKVVHTPMC